MTTLPQASTQPTINEKLEMPLDTIIQKSGNTTNNTNTEQKTQKKSYGKARNNYNNNNNQGNFNNNNNNQNNFNSNQQNQNNQNGNSGNNQNSGNRGRRNNRVAPYEQKQRSYNNNNNNQGQNNNYSSSNNNNTNNQNTSNNQNNNNTSVVSNSSSNNSTKKVVKVSSKSNVKSVAGAIAHTTRSGESPTLMATGSESVNQAVKAISIARQYLSENKLDVSVQPIYRNQEKGAVTFLLTKQSLRKKNELDDDSQQLRVARNSDPNSVAGSIANKVRAGERVVIQAIGAGSVAITVRAISLARRFLEGDAIDLCFRPEFIHVKLEEDERSAIKFTILAQQT